MSKKSLSIVVVVLAVLLIAGLVFGAVQYEKYSRIYKAIMTATNNPAYQVVYNILPSPVANNIASTLVHGVYGAQQFAKKLATRVNLPPPMVLKLQTTDAGLVLAVDSANNLYILFRGTLFDYEWKHDFDFIQVPALVGALQGKVHKGFQHMYLKYRPYILNYLQQYNPPTVFVAGHSLGAALTTLTLYDLCKSGKPVTAYTFAPPKVGDADFVNAVTACLTPTVTLTQVVNTADLVPLIPLSVMPNTWVPKTVLFYEHIQADKMITFYVNNKSWQNNHSLALHMAFVDGQVTSSE